MSWVFGELKNGGIRICQECGEVTLEDEMHWHGEEKKDPINARTELNKKLNNIREP